VQRIGDPSGTPSPLTALPETLPGERTAESPALDAIRSQIETIEYGSKTPRVLDTVSSCAGPLGWRFHFRTPDPARALDRNPSTSSVLTIAA